jgi:hemolysin activation/secretion protein
VQKINVDIAHGLDALGANASTVVRVGDLAEVTQADPQFTRYDATFTQSNLWPQHFGTVFNITGQYSNNTLPTTEQVSFGGPRYGLAYDPGETAGDSGWGASMELNRRFDISSSWIKQVTPYLIGQFARVYLNVGEPNPAKLGTAGVGVRWSDKHYYSFDLTFAEPVGDVPIGAPHREPRVDFSFSYQLH